MAGSGGTPQLKLILSSSDRERKAVPRKRNTVSLPTTTPAKWVARKGESFRSLTRGRQRWQTGRGFSLIGRETVRKIASRGSVLRLPPARRSWRWLAASLLVGVVGAVANAETASFSAVYWDVGSQRWRDTATTPYDVDPIGSYDYATATVQLEYSESGPALTCVLTGSGLKPNFTYQVKLNGKPSYSWGAAGDDDANERLGFAGRWRLSQVKKSTGSVVGGWNSDDDEYLLWKSRSFEDDTYRYVFEGYLLFDYVVTDAAGDASQTLSVDSSFHVLWKVSQRPLGDCHDPRRLPLRRHSAARVLRRHRQRRGRMGRLRRRPCGSRVRRSESRPAVLRQVVEEQGGERLRFGDRADAPAGAADVAFPEAQPQALESPRPASLNRVQF